MSNDRNVNGFDAASSGHYLFETNELADIMDTVRYPDSKTELTLSYLVDDGSEEGQETTMRLRGENAESLPLVVQAMQDFLTQAGYDVELLASPMWAKRARVKWSNTQPMGTANAA